MTDGRITPLRALRESTGLSLRDLEKLTGINRGRLSIIERGVPPTIAESRAILDALKADDTAA